jgi:hypothetical protein
MGETADKRGSSAGRTRDRAPRLANGVSSHAAQPASALARPPAERVFSTRDAVGVPPDRSIAITHELRIDGDDAEALWEAYRENFAPLAELAILQHLYPRDEILAELANPDILKIVGRQQGQPVGLGMLTNVLEAVPQISPQFLRAKYPEHAARRAIYFGILVMVSPRLRGRTLFGRIYTEMWQVPARVGGVLAFDICEFNRTAFDTDTLTGRIASQFPRAQVGVVDRQTWYVAELPEPLFEPPHSERLRERR